jgi:hypothetical protein
MVSSTNSAVDPTSPSVFHYRERSGVIWGKYDGDTVVFGRFVGTRVGDRLAVSFVHELRRGGPVVAGTADSRIRSVSGQLELVEEFVVDGTPHISVCREQYPDPALE